jgi:hypothetical protein
MSKKNNTLLLVLGGSAAALTIYEFLKPATPAAPANAAPATGTPAPTGTTGTVNSWINLAKNALNLGQQGYNTVSNAVSGIGAFPPPLKKKAGRHIVLAPTVQKYFFK